MPWEQPKKWQKDKKKKMKWVGVPLGRCIPLPQGEQALLPEKGLGRKSQCRRTGSSGQGAVSWSWCQRSNASCVPSDSPTAIISISMIWSRLGSPTPNRYFQGVTLPLHRGGNTHQGAHPLCKVFFYISYPSHLASRLA